MELYAYRTHFHIFDAEIQFQFVVIKLSLLNAMRDSFVLSEKKGILRIPWPYLFFERRHCVNQKSIEDKNSE